MEQAAAAALLVVWTAAFAGLINFYNSSGSRVRPPTYGNMS
jgi:hypothetical protein